MSPARLTDQVDDQNRATWWAMVWLTGMVLAPALALALVGRPPTEPWHRGLLLAVALITLPLPFVALDNLQAQRRVLAARLAPRAAWVASLKEHQRHLWQVWGLAAAPLALLRVAAEPSAEGLQLALLTAALLAAWLGMLLMLAAAVQALLSPGWGVALGLVLLVVLGSWEAADIQGRLQEAGWLAWAALALLLPVSLGTVHRPLQTPGPAGPGAPVPGPEATPWRRFVRFWEGSDRAWRGIDRPLARGAFVPVFAMAIHNQVELVRPDRGYLQPWDSTVTAWHVLRVAAFSLLALGMLRSTAPHWRRLLAPQGPQRRHLGWRVIAATGWGMAVDLLLAALLVLVGYQLLGKVQWRQLPAGVAVYTLPLLVDLLLATCLAAWLRAQAGGLARAAWVLGAGAAVTFATLWLIGMGPRWEGGSSAVLWQRGVIHHATELALAAMFALLAQRAWARVDLGELGGATARARRRWG